MTACGAKELPDIGDSTTASQTNETTEITTEVSGDVVLEEQLKMHEISDGIYEADLDYNFGFMTDQLVKDSYYVVSGQVEGVMGMSIIDLRTGELVKQFGYGDGYMIQNGNDVTFVGYDGNNYTFHDFFQEPEKISDDDVVKLLDERNMDYSFSARGIQPAVTTEAVMAVGDMYTLTISWIDTKMYIGIYGENGDLLHYEKAFYKDSELPIDTSVDGNGVYLMYYDYQTSENHLFYMDMTGKTPIEKKYFGKYEKGITILTGNDVFIPANEPYDITPITDETEIMYAKQSVQSALDRFPDGFFDELLSGEKCPRQSLVICLTGTIYQDADVSNPGGMAFFDDDTYYILLDVTGAWEGVDFSYNTAHEMMHVIDSYLDYIGETYDEWVNYQPYEDCYASQYNGEDGSMGDFAYTFIGEEESDRVWFVGDYSKVNYLEDRATTFAVMFAREEMYKDYPHIVDKMNYISSILRKNFESVQNSRYVEWEY